MGRPIGVTIVGILVVIAGVFYVLSAILGIFNAGVRADFGFFSLLLILILGLIYLAVAKGLFSGNNGSRLIVGLVTVIGLIAGVVQMIFASDARLNGLVNVIISLVILGVLFSRKATLFFTQR